MGHAASIVFYAVSPALFKHGRTVRHSSGGSDPIAPPLVMYYYEAWNLKSATMDLVSRVSKRAPSQVFHSVRGTSLVHSFRVSAKPFGGPD
jgi:hypothetical protein